MNYYILKNYHKTTAIPCSLSLSRAERTGAVSIPTRPRARPQIKFQICNFLREIAFLWRIIDHEKFEIAFRRRRRRRWHQLSQRPERETRFPVASLRVIIFFVCRHFSPPSSLGRLADYPEGIAKCNNFQSPIRLRFRSFSRKILPHRRHQMNGIEVLKHFFVMHARLPRNGGSEGAADV